MTRMLMGSLSLGLVLCVAGPAPAADTKFSQAQLEEMVAPIALYPDEVLSRCCIAATYPLEIVEAERWRDKNPSLQGDALDKALGAVDWDPSVKSLTSFPDVLDRMSNNLEWTKDLGDAFLEPAQRADGRRAAPADQGVRRRHAQDHAAADGRAPAAGRSEEHHDPADEPGGGVRADLRSPPTVYGPSYVAPARRTTRASGPRRRAVTRASRVRRRHRHGRADRLGLQLGRPRRLRAQHYGGGGTTVEAATTATPTST